jgi:hypothetical protein
MQNRIDVLKMSSYSHVLFISLDFQVGFLLWVRNPIYFLHVRYNFELLYLVAIISKAAHKPM